MKDFEWHWIFLEQESKLVGWGDGVGGTLGLFFNKCGELVWSVC